MSHEIMWVCHLMSHEHTSHEIMRVCRLMSHQNMSHNQPQTGSGQQFCMSSALCVRIWGPYGGLCPPPPVVDDTPPSSADTELDERPEAVLPRPAPTWSCGTCGARLYSHRIVAYLRCPACGARAPVELEGWTFPLVRSRKAALAWTRRDHPSTR